MKNLKCDSQTAFNWEQERHEEIVPTDIRIHASKPIGRRERLPVSEVVLKLINDGTLDFLDVVRIPEKKKPKTVKAQLGSRNRFQPTSFSRRY